MRLEYCSVALGNLPSYKLAPRGNGEQREFKRFWERYMPVNRLDRRIEIYIKTLDVYLCYDEYAGRCFRWNS